MKQARRRFIVTLVSMVVSLMMTIPVLAVPQLPASFFGMVKVNNANVPDGTSVQALIGGQVFAETVTQTYQGDSVYALDVKGDDTDTSAQDGGREGDTIEFKIGGVVADQTAAWHSGTNINLNLSASGSAPVATPRATLTPVPTQTAIPTRKPTATALPPTPKPAEPTATSAVLSSPEPTLTGAVSITPGSTVAPSENPTQPAQPSLQPTRQTQSSQSSAASDSPTGDGVSNLPAVVVPIIIVILVILAGYLFLVSRRKKM